MNKTYIKFYNGHEEVYKVFCEPKLSMQELRQIAMETIKTINANGFEIANELSTYGVRNMDTTLIKQEDK